LFGLAVGMTACTLLVDTGGFSSPSSTTTTPDAANDAPPGVNDAAGQAEAGDSSSSITPLDCSDPKIVVCEGFDTAAAVAKYKADIDEGTSVSFEDKVVASPPGAARFEIGGGLSNNSPDATLELVADETLTDFSIEARLHIEYGEPVEKGRLFLVSTGTENLYLESAGNVEETSTNVGQLGAIPRGRWLPFRVEIRLGDNPKTATFSVDDKTTGKINLGGGWTPGRPFIRIGISEAFAPQKGWLVRWDNLVVKRL